MGSNWHLKDAERPRKEWVVYAAAGLVLLIVAGAVMAGVMLGNKKKGGSEEAGNAAIEGSFAPAQSSVARPPSAGSPPTRPPPAALRSPSPLPPAAGAVNSPPPVGLPSPPPSSAPPTPAAAGSPPLPAAQPALPPPSPTLAPTTTAVSTYDPSLQAVSTTDGAPDGMDSPSYTHPDIPASKQGTCEFQAGREARCRDDMDYGSTTPLPFTSFQAMYDSESMETCGFVDMTQIVNGLIKWAYKGKCGVSHFTTARACVGKAGLADGYWRALAMLWPLPGGDPATCVPLCIKMRGYQNSVTDYGRTGSC